MVEIPLNEHLGRSFTVSLRQTRSQRDQNFTFIY